MFTNVNVDAHMDRTIIEVKNPTWTNAEKTMLQADVLFDIFAAEGFHPFSWTVDQADTWYGQEIERLVLAGEAGPIAEFVMTREYKYGRFPTLMNYQFLPILKLRNLQTRVDDAIKALEEPFRSVTHMKFYSLSVFYRLDPLMDQLGLTDEELDDVWSEASKL